VLKGIDPLLNADLLHVLRAMGHGDDIAVVDCNFPAASVAAETVTGELIRLDAVDLPRAMRAILSVMPLDSFVDEPVRRMEVMGKPDEILEAHRDVQAVMDETDGGGWKMGSIERFAFYGEAKKAFAVVATGERRPYACFLAKKGVIPAP